jgi:hypothetical protein
MLRHPISLFEVQYLRRKTGTGFEVAVGSRRYSGLWSYLQDKKVGSWQQKGTCPRELVAELYELLLSSQTKGIIDVSHFRNGIKSINDQLKCYTPQDVNAFYAQTIKLGRQTIFLVDLLIDSLECEADNFMALIQPLQSWLTSYDKSFVVGEPKPLSKRGLLNRLQSLKNDTCPGVSDCLFSIISKIQQLDHITPEIINDIKSLYALRWQGIKDSDSSYTNNQPTPNELWISLAQELSGGRYIQPNYYLLLMPTLTNDKDLMTQDSTIKFNLQDCIVSDDGTSLIYLPQCAQHLTAKGTFYVPGEHPRPLSVKEQFQIRSFHPTYEPFLKFYENIVAEPLSISTIRQLKRLVNLSLKPHGLMLLHHYSNVDLTQAEQAFEDFFQFYGNMDKLEKRKLDRHVIIFNGEKKIFSTILNEIIAGECVAVKCQWFAQLVIDYFPDLSFNQHIEEGASIGEMRLASQGLLLRQDAWLINYLQMIYLSLLSQNQAGPWVEVRAFGFKHAIPDGIGETIFKRLTQLFETQNYHQAPEVYASLTQEIRKILDDQTYIAKLAYSPALVFWMQDIINLMLPERVV